MSADDFCINKLVPGYFSRINEDGSYSNGSGCGNDTESERNMVRKYIGIPYVTGQTNIIWMVLDLTWLDF